MSKTPEEKIIESELFNRQRLYREVLNTESPQVMMFLEDLARFCRAHETTYSTDPRDHAQLEGRRQVWLRIQEHLNLDSKLLWELYTRTRYV